MIHKLLFAAAAAVTAFALVLLGGVVAQVSPAAASSNEANVQAQAAQQSAAYQSVIQQANDQLQQAYQQQQTLQQQLSLAQQHLADTQQQLASAQQQLANAPQTNSSTASTLTAEQAVALAMQMAPGSRLLQQPQLVNLQGYTAYEVMLDSGTLYLDAATGQMLAAVPSGRSGNGQSSASRGEGQGDDNN